MLEVQTRTIAKRPAIVTTTHTDGKIMSDERSDLPWSSATKKPREQSISEIMQERRADGNCSPGRLDLRDLLVQRTMARHGFTKEQALAVILAFGG
jgi:hypothetical protein